MGEHNLPFVSFGQAVDAADQVGVVGQPGAGGVVPDIVLQPDGKIVVVGAHSFTTETGGITSDFALSRYHPDGSLDTSFGTEGKVTTDVTGGDDSAWGVAVQPDEKIVVVGKGSNDFVLARYTPEGNLDSSFGTAARSSPTSPDARTGPWT